jgi:Helicase associated domain
VNRIASATTSMWSSTQILRSKRLLPSLGSSFQRSLRRATQNCRPSRFRSFCTSHLLPPIQYVLGQQYAWQPQPSHRILFSNTALFSEPELVVHNEENDAPKTDSVASVSRRRRPLRISSVPNRNIGEQRLYFSPGSEYERKWNSNVKKFEAFVQQKLQTKNGQAFPLFQPSEYPSDPSLRNWLSRVRNEYNKKLRGQPNRLTDQRIEQLRQMGFQFTKTAHRNSWDIMFQQLCTYLKEHDGRYPHEADLSTLSKEDIKLHIWCSRQRVLYKAFVNQKYDKTCINEKRIKALNSINFVWSVLESQWDEKYEELKQYFKEHGTTLVPSTYRHIGNYSLARWVDNQRRHYTLRNQNKPSKLTDERIELLNKLDFIWDPLEVRWMERYNALVEYQRLNGLYEMPTTSSDPSLRRWVVLQRKQYHKWMNGEPSKMSARRKELLDRLGMDWAPTPARKSRTKKK